MKSVLTAEFAVLFQLKPVGIILLVLFCVVVSLLAFCANESNLDSYIISHDLSAPPVLNLPDAAAPAFVPPSAAVLGLKNGAFQAQRKSLARRGRAIIPRFLFFVNSFFVFF